MVVDGNPANVAILQTEIMAEYPAYGLEDIGCLSGDLRSDAVTGQYSDLKLQRDPPSIFGRRSTVVPRRFNLVRGELEAIGANRWLAYAGSSQSSPTRTVWFWVIST